GVDELGPCEHEKGNLAACLMAAQNFLTKCFAQRGLTTEPGQNVGNLAAHFNVRFDLFEASSKDLRSNSAFAPAPNVVKGKITTVNNGGQCKYADADTVMLPRDECLPNCGADRERFGDGVYDWTNYVDKNHGNGDGTADADEWPEGTDPNDPP